MFGSERRTGALLDRLTHHVHILEMNGDSYRLKGSLQSAAALAPCRCRPPTLSRRDPPPHRPGRDRQASPRWYSFTPPSLSVLRVMAGLLWPSQAETALTFRPDCSQWRAQLWRRLWEAGPLTPVPVAAA